MKLAIYFIMISSNAGKLTDNLILNLRISMEDQFTHDQPKTDWGDYRFKLLCVLPLAGAAIGHGMW